MASEDELVQIINSFLLNAPPGEFREVVTDIRALVPNEGLINNTAYATFREHNTEQMVMVESPNKEHKLLITKYGEVADGEFLDPQGGQVITYDHIKQQVTGARPISGELDSSLEPLRHAVEKAFIQYTADHFPHGASTVYGKDGEIIACLSSVRFNPSNFWNGRWRSAWTYSNGKLTVHYKIVVHYYEDGNVQLHTDTSQSFQVEAGNPEATAQNIIKAVAKADQAYQQSLDTSYQTMGETTFKALRRALPITRMKIDWNKIRNYKIGGEMSQK